MNRLAADIKGRWAANRKLFLTCLISVFIWGMISHAYGFFSGAFSHDSLNEFNAAVFGDEWKIQLGRVLVPAYHALVRSVLTLPWLVGITALFYIGISVFITVKIFRVRTIWAIILIAGLFTVNQTVTSTAATYITDLDSNMLALLLSVIAVYLWQRYRYGFLIGIVPVGLSMGLYQGFVTMTITLVLIDLTLDLLKGQDAKAVFVQGLKAVVMLIGGGILYLILMKVICFATGVEILSGNYNSVDTFLSMSIGDFIYYIIRAYLITCYNILAPVSLYPFRAVVLVHVIMIGIGACIVIWKWISIKWKEKLLTVLLIALMPLGMNIAYVLSGGVGHDVMYYAIWMDYLFVILLAQLALSERNPVPQKKISSGLKRGASVVSVCLVCAVLWSNVQTANAVYLKKDLEEDASLSLFTRIIYEMESTEDYIPGETPVVFVGNPSELIEEVVGFDYIAALTGAGYTSVLGAAGRDYYQAYFDYILLNPAIMADSETWDEVSSSEAVEEMPSWPEAGSVQMINGVLVVKLS